MGVVPHPAVPGEARAAHVQAATSSIGIAAGSIAPKHTVTLGGGL